MSTKVQENLTTVALKPTRSIVCARCCRPVGDEAFRVGPFTYGACCILKVEGAKV
jgi:hypothetical protein